MKLDLTLHVSDACAATSAAQASAQFGLIGGLFVLLICFWVEIGLSLFMQTALDRAVRKEARLIRTGTIQGFGRLDPRGEPVRRPADADDLPGHPGQGGLGGADRLARGSGLVVSFLPASRRDQVSAPDRDLL